ncbi:MAG: peroxiredoxin [Rhodocyclaceae bacterium]|nr:peroxiredoxin [Rhodocyclaceae bacterium]
MVEIGDIAPLFSLPDADMELFDLASEIGRSHVVLYFYPRDNTPGCTLQAADFSDHEDEFAKFDCIVVGVSPDDCLTHAEFRDQHGLSVRLLSDEDTEVCRMYDVWQSRDVDGVKKMGVMRTTFIIDKQGIVRHVFRNVSPRGHAAEVFKLIRNLESEHANGNSQEHRRNA